MTEMNRKLPTAKEAAEYLGFRATTLRNARHTGKLAGVQAPGYLKLGCSVRYEKSIQYRAKTPISEHGAEQRRYAPDWTHLQGCRRTSYPNPPACILKLSKRWWRG
jgi:hypothetical protein